MESTRGGSSCVRTRESRPFQRREPLAAEAADRRAQPPSEVLRPEGL